MAAAGCSVQQKKLTAWLKNGKTDSDDNSEMDIAAPHLTNGTHIENGGVDECSDECRTPNSTDIGDISDLEPAAISKSLRLKSVDSDSYSFNSDSTVVLQDTNTDTNTDSNTTTAAAAAAAVAEVVGNSTKKSALDKKTSIKQRKSNNFKSSSSQLENGSTLNQIKSEEKNVNGSNSDGNSENTESENIKHDEIERQTDDTSPETTCEAISEGTHQGISEGDGDGPKEKSSSILASIIKGELDAAPQKRKLIPKQTARKTGFPLRKIKNPAVSSETVKTVNLFPIANMALNLPEIETALGITEIRSESRRDHANSAESTDSSNTSPLVESAIAPLTESASTPLAESDNSVTSKTTENSKNNNNNAVKRKRRRFGRYDLNRKRKYGKRKLRTDHDNTGSDSEATIDSQDCDDQLSSEGAPPSKKLRLDSESIALKPATNSRGGRRRRARKSFPPSLVSSSVTGYHPIQKSVTSSSIPIASPPQTTTHLITVPGIGKRVITLQPPSAGSSIPTGKTPVITGINNKGQSVVIPVVPISAESIANTQATTVFFIPNNPSITTTGNHHRITANHSFNHPFLLPNPARPSNFSPVQPATVLPRLTSASILRTNTNIITATSTSTQQLTSTATRQMPTLKPAVTTVAKNLVTMTSLLSSSPPQLIKYNSPQSGTSVWSSSPQSGTPPWSSSPQSGNTPSKNRHSSPNGIIHHQKRTVRNHRSSSGSAPAAHITSPIVTMLKTDCASGSLTPSTTTSLLLSTAATRNVHRTPYNQVKVTSEETPDLFDIPLCSCKVRGTRFANVAKVSYCQALDSIDDKIVGCSNKVSGGGVLLRPAVKIPFMAFCEQHQSRLKSHQCCPSCGHFCTQGKFYQCRKEDESVIHQFHRECQIFRNGKYLCPHCGEESVQHEITVKRSDAKKQLQFQRERAKMTGLSFTKVRQESEEAEDEGKSLEIISNNKRLTSKGLPLGPTRTQMELILTYMEAERPKKLRLSAKNLYMVSKNGELDKVIFMLAEGFDPNCEVDEFKKRSPLHAAATYGHLAIVHCLLQAGANPNVEDEVLVKPIMCAAENNHVNVMKLLIKSGAVIETRDDDGMTCIHLAAKHGHLETLKYILDEKLMDISTLDDGGWTALVWASEYKRIDTVRYLLSQGSDPNIKDNEENIALHWAAFSGSVDIVELFLTRGCDLESMNEVGDRPLHVAARQNHYECVALLLARGADVEAVNNASQTPLECCPDNDSSAWMALKVNKQLKKFAAKRSDRPEKLLHRDLSFGKDKTAMPVVNSVDDEDWPRDFMYVTANVETSQLNINRTITSLHNCQCEDDCSTVTCPCTQISIKCWYDKEGRLLPEFNMLEPPILFECNRSCRCWANCYNRVVQNGVLTRLQIFRTVGRGWGVRALLDIQRGTFICEYIGELISDSEADIREDDSYLFDLDNRDGETYCIDARKYGNIARFINHLCEPNIIPVKVFVDHQDLRFPHICFFSSREIKAGEELGFDYGVKFWVIKWKQFLCACGTAKCKYSSDRIQQTLDDYHKRMQEEEHYDN
ncbi:uncharacterized protein LOC141908408 [Tubulanus polymorphus]|uniref:uncharacterized protein LOC141908408 n=1 Tax=Tubulanus polymorphus TaxID=672921 RepID=UPI003DA65F6E